MRQKEGNLRKSLAYSEEAKVHNISHIKVTLHSTKHERRHDLEENRNGRNREGNGAEARS
jgi:hypothetical protein